MKFVRDLSPPVRVLMALLAVTIPAAHADAGTAGPAVALAGATDGSALEKALEADPGTRTEIAARAEALGLALIEIAVGKAAESQKALRIAGGGKPFRDCQEAEGCPPMVVVPASPPGFKIGSPEGEEGRLASEKQTEVSVEAFAISTRPVTVAEYKACVAAGGCDQPEWLERGGQHNIETGTSRYYAVLGEHLTNPGQPVVGVSHENAQQFARWLAENTGQRYRLPSEAEWEFAARAGTTTAYWWGDAPPSAGRPQAVCEDCGTEWDMKAVAPAQSFDPNPWGLYNVHGNVWEWVADIFCDDYASGPRDGTARIADDCAAVGNRPPMRGLYTMRGGSAFFPAKSMRSAMRLRQKPDFRNISVGFRVARDLAP
ncbi:hypothetical protein W911_16175 [Hyphomicrobium nitrativorans NL23]|uniref:Sulfatase-modifying factor enzyme-like domain-containing protein n=1 Tax=Hyphomicrobium nitrativorans NL23 TaxID=1029756 RepID=V5SKA9_9HYPH|nr:formylglycine-generating enzyme family protein [Hyphomicrobium nitrativorans]AHB50404.1 hypothetical protein W911_16175 [Hyphomicrobium nitrativorans NL23]